MRFRVRLFVLAVMTGALIAAPATARAALRTESGIASFFAANCKVESCHKVSEAEEKEKAEAEGYTQAAGHPNFGITDFTVATEGSGEHQFPVGTVEHIRTDVAPGVSTNPESPEKCTAAEFGTEVAPATFLAPTCPGGSLIGENKVIVAVPLGGGVFQDVPLHGNVYNLVQPKGLGSEFGVAIELPEFITKSKIPLFAHTLIEGNVEWGAEAAGTGRADYHDYFEINVSTALPLISSRLVFKGKVGEPGFLTNPTSCTGIGPQTTTTLKLKFAGAPKPVKAEYETPIGTEGCGLVPFEPGLSLEQETKAPDTPDGLTAEVKLPHDTVEQEEEEGKFDDSDVKTASVTLPPGITLNPSASNGLEACTPAQIGIGTKNPITCPEGSEIGTVRIDVPGLPPGSLEGSVYLGGPPSGPITGPPYVIYVAANSERYGLSVRLRGLTFPNEETGQLTTNFTENPQQPFSRFILHFRTGALSPLANGLRCEAAAATSVFTPFTETAAKSPAANFEVTGCPSTIPFAIGQSTENETATGGGHTSYTFNLARADGQQYLHVIKTTLPEGLVGAIPAITLCTEPQAALGTCGAASRIGTATVTAGAGRIPRQFSGPVFMTGPYNGAPFGLSIAVPAVAGPFNLGTVVTRATINVNPFTTRVTAESVLPTIVKGVPLRLRSISVAVNKQGFLFNPTNCAPQATETTLTSTFGTAIGLASPFQVEGCSGLAFKPSFKASTGAHFSKTKGANLVTTLTQGGGQANIRSVLVSLPKQLPSRLTTLQKACTEATFAANPFSCPEASNVGTATAVTPTLPGTMKGPAYLVSHGGAAFPDLDLVLEGSGVRVILVGNTDIKKGITTTHFATTPDVPVSSVTVNLPTGPHSALAGFGDLCRRPLIMPTTIEGWNGKVTKQNTHISVTGCGVKVVGHKVIGHTAYLTIKTFGPGRITASGRGASTTRRSLSRASNATTLKVRLHRRGRIRIKVSFVPHGKAAVRSSTRVTVRGR